MKPRKRNHKPNELQYLKKKKVKKIMLITNSKREKGLLSVVIPAYCEEETVPLAAETISRLLQKADIPSELIFIDDGSKDSTWATILNVSEKFSEVRGIQFSRNFGKESAIFAGLAQSRGDCVVVIDCDLQHPPEKIIEMYEKWLEGYQIVEGVKLSRGKENPLHTFSAKTFYHFIGKATGLDMSKASDFKLLDRRAVDVLLGMQEKDAFFRALSAWIGFTTTQVSFEVQERVAGSSKWSINSLIKYAITNLASFSTAPLQMVTVLGILVFASSLVLGAHTIYQKIQGFALDGFTTVILLQLFLGSILMMCLGIIGYYIAKIYEAIQGRPRFIIENTVETPTTDQNKEETT